MLFLTRWFGVTGSDAERNLAREQSDIKEITERVLLMQANAAAQQHQPLRRGTHAKGVCARAKFEVFDVTVGRDRKLAARLARGMFAKPGVYPAIVRFGNADPKANSDFKPDVRSLSFSVDLTRDGTAIPDAWLEKTNAAVICKMYALSHPNVYRTKVHCTSWPRTFSPRVWLSCCPPGLK
jgi:hypothetical protein